MSAPAEQADPTLRLDDLLERCLEAFLPSAPLDDASRLREFLPQPLDSDTESPARFLVGELVKLDMAAVAEIGGLPRLERYADALPDLLSLDAMPFDLVIEEYQLRREAGKDPKQSEYAQRFPQHAELLAQFSCDAPTVAPTGKPAAVPAELEPAETIDDFAIVQPLGKGAFAHVYLARQQSMQRLVALKVSAGKGDEPQALAQFDHPNIVRVFDQRMLNGGKTHLLYMQYLPGGTLADVVKRVRWTPLESRSGAILLEAVDDNLLNAAQQAPDGSTLRAWLESAPWPTAVAWLGVQLARALDEAHAHGVLHRDVKPANVLLSAEGVPKLADFNVSFAGAAGRAGAAASLGGSIGYMAPEHLRAIGGLPGTSPEDVVEPADFYSLAVLLWELWQGRRPFEAGERPESWTDAVAQQIVSRECDLVEPERTGQSSERVLEETLRQTLVWDVDERPASGAELAGRLRLALHPEAAALFDPPPGNWRKRILSMRVLLVTAIAILTPNIVSGVFNYLYNESVIINKPHGNLVGEEFVSFKHDFKSLATMVNSVAFPLGAALLIGFSLPIARAIRAVKRGEEPPADSLDSLFALPRRAALIGGTLWGIASLVYPLVMRAWHPVFPFDEAWHFCLSLLVCGGVAAVYPYFLLAVVATGVYYPRLVRRSMQDPAFDERGEQLRREAGAFLLAAAVIPLLAIALLLSVSVAEMQVDVIRVAVVASLVGLFAAFSTYRYVLSTWDRMAPVLSPSRSAGTPGLSEHQ